MSPLPQEEQPTSDGAELYAQTRLALNLFIMALQQAVYFQMIGGGANYICMPNGDDVEYQDEATTANLNLARVYAAEYRMQNGQALDHLHDYTVLCTVCAVSSRSAQVMIPGRLTCPDTWTVEYTGWLVADRNTHNRAMFICLDKSPEATMKTSTSIQGARMHHVEAACSSTGLPCPPFDVMKELACVVCTK